MRGEEVVVVDGYAYSGASDLELCDTGGLLYFDRLGILPIISYW